MGSPFRSPAHSPSLKPFTLSSNPRSPSLRPVPGSPSSISTISISSSPTATLPPSSAFPAPPPAPPLLPASSQDTGMTDKQFTHRRNKRGGPQGSNTVRDRTTSQNLRLPSSPLSTTTSPVASPPFKTTSSPVTSPRAATPGMAQQITSEVSSLNLSDSAAAAAATTASHRHHHHHHYVPAYIHHTYPQYAIPQSPVLRPLGSPTGPVTPMSLEDRITDIHALHTAISKLAAGNTFLSNQLNAPHHK